MMALYTVDTGSSSWCCSSVCYKAIVIDLDHNDTASDLGNNCIVLHNSSDINCKELAGALVSVWGRGRNVFLVTKMLCSKSYVTCWHVGKCRDYLLCSPSTLQGQGISLAPGGWSVWQLATT